MGISPCGCGCPQSPEKGIKHPGGVVIGDCELLNLASGN